MLIVADDLTGAADAAAPFAAAGLRTVVRLFDDVVHRADPGADADEPTVLSVDTHARTMTELEAAAATGASIRSARRRPVFVKIDSTLRGHVRATVEAAIDACAVEGEGPERVIVCPAFPTLGRSVVDGRVRVDGEPIDAGDIRELFDGFDRCEIVVPDAASDDDLAEIIESNEALRGRVLWVGSAGLAHALAARHPPGGEQLERRSAERVLVIVGTRHARTAAQLDAIGHRALITTLDPRDDQSISDLRMLIDQADALVLTGGFTARRVLAMLGVAELRVGGEIEAGLPWSITDVDGRFLTIATKAGGFGGPTSLARAVDFLSAP